MALAERPVTSHVAGELLSAYVDGELTADDRNQVERHLQDCATCRVAIYEYRSTSAMLRGMATQPVPAQLGRDLRRRLPTPAGDSATRRRRRHAAA